MPKYYLAIDIGASSGRHIVGWNENGAIQTQEVYRFTNGVTNADGHLTWDIDALVSHVKTGIEATKEKYPRIESLSIDTWGVDYVLMKGDREALPCYAYRDSRTQAVIQRVHERIPFAELYRRTGIQFQPFNTIYQLYADRPTGGMVSAVTGEFNPEIITMLGLPPHLFHPLQRVGTVIGEYEEIKVILCATHDTGSAVEGIPMEENAPYISSGTWSLLGVRTDKPLTDDASRLANWSNEGGVGYNRYQKNIMGMWLANRLREELCSGRAWSEITDEAERSSFGETVGANEEKFLAPSSMKAAFDSALSEKPACVGDYFRCAYRSLAQSYRQALEELERHTGKRYDRIYIVGGGAKNGFLNRLTEEATGKKVIALPIEATAIGNLKIQMEADR